MAGEARQPDHPLARALREQGHRFAFFQAVRLLERLHPFGVPVGHQGPPAREAIRFRPVLDLGSPASEVAAIRETEAPGGGTRHLVEITFMGLYGASSPLPLFYTEDLLAEEEEGVTRDFLDLFHHRLLSLYYRAWEKYQYAVRLRADGRDAISLRLLALLGMEVGRLPGGHQIPAIRLLGLAGLVTQRPPTADSVQSALAMRFGEIPVEVEPCVPRWRPIPAAQRSALGITNARLGDELYLGERILDRSGTFRVAFGPMALRDFSRFLPGGDWLDEAREIVDVINTDALDWEVELSLAPGEAPEARLGSEQAKLGWTTWIGNRTGDRLRIRFRLEGWLHGRG